jgi:hypothetical protein
MVSLVLTIIAFAGAMGVPAFLTAIVESASKIRPSSSRTKASRRMNWIDRCRPVAMLLPRNGTLRARGTSRTPYGTRWKSGAAFSMRKSQTGQREKWLIFESRWGGVRGQFQLAKWDPQLVAKYPPLASGLDAGAVFERVDRICRSKPDYALLQVAHDLVQELDPQHRNLVRVCDPFAPVR